MKKDKFIKKLSNHLENKYHLTNSNEFIVSTLKSLILKHPKLNKYLNKKDEDITLLDLQVIMSYLETDKRINKFKFRKKYKNIVQRSQQSKFDKMMMVHDFLTVIFSIYLALLINYLKNKKRKKFNSDDGLEKSIDDFLKGKFNSISKTKLDISPKA